MSTKEKTPLFLRSVALIKAIPSGKVLTYSEVANLIGAPGCARHISFVLSSSSKKYDLPWHRVVNSKGKISLPVHNHYFRQKKLLENEGILFIEDKIDLKSYLWKPSKSLLNKTLKGIPKHIPLRAR